MIIRTKQLVVVPSSGLPGPSHLFCVSFFYIISSLGKRLHFMACAATCTY